MSSQIWIGDDLDFPWGAGRNAELDHGHRFQTSRLGEFCGFEKAERILLPHHQIEGNFCFVTAEECDKDRKDVQVQRFRKPFIKNSA